MSADAKAWIDEPSDGRMWKGCHDGECHSEIPHDQGSELSVLLIDIENCMGGKMRWIVKKYAGDEIGLVGYMC